MIGGVFEHDEKLARWFAEHKQVITVAEAEALGVGHDALQRRYEAGLLVRDKRAVYRSAGVPAGFASSLRAALGAAGPDAWVSGPSLMRIYGTRGEWSARPEITVLGCDHPEIPGVRVRRIDRIDEQDVRVHHGFPALAPPLGLLTLGASVPRGKVEVAVHDMVFQGHTALPQLVDVLKRYAARGRNGVADFRHGIRSLDPRGRATQTNMELEILRVVRHAGLLEPELQLPVVDGDGRRRRLDLAWPGRMLDVETDGDRWHTSTRDRAEMQRRDAALRAVGYEIVRLDSAEAEDRRLVIDRLRPFFDV
jgi:hypothetical protein